MKVFYCLSGTVFCADSESAFKKSKIDCLRVAVDVESSKIDFFFGKYVFVSNRQISKIIRLNKIID